MTRPYSLLLMLSVVAPVGAASPATQPSRLALAIEHVESGGRTDIIGDSGQAVGCMQIHPITVRECNRILGRNEFTLADRTSRTRSHAMFRVITERWNASDEIIARRWNGGPRGETKQATKGYWERVKRSIRGAAR